MHICLLLCNILSLMDYEILYDLLTTGIYNITKPYNLESINMQLRLLHCHAQLWYDKKTLILVYEKTPMSRQLKENIRTNIKIIDTLIEGDKVEESESLQMLFDNGWVERERDQIILSKKFVIQYKDYIISKSSQYNICQVCDILVKGDKIHEYCKEYNLRARQNMFK